MNNTLRILSFASLGAVLLGLSMPASAQETALSRAFRIRSIESSKVASPSGGGTASWLEIRTEYETAPEWVNEIDFTYYVMMENTKLENPLNLFRARLTSVNVKKGRHSSVVFMHPDTVERYGQPRSYAVVANIQGQLAGWLSEPESRERWWERYSPVDGLLYNRLQLPVVDDADYTAIRVEP